MISGAIETGIGAYKTKQGIGIAATGVGMCSTGVGCTAGGVLAVGGIGIVGTGASDMLSGTQKMLFAISNNHINTLNGRSVEEVYKEIKADENKIVVAPFKDFNPAREAYVALGGTKENYYMLSLMGTMATPTLSYYSDFYRSNMSAPVSQSTNTEIMTRETKNNNYSDNLKIARRTVYINDGTPGGTEKVKETVIANSKNLAYIRNNLSTGESSVVVINKSGQILYQKVTPPSASAGALMQIEKTVANSGMTSVNITENSFSIPTRLYYVSSTGPIKGLVMGENGYLNVPVYGGTTVIGAGTNPIKGAYNIDYSPTISGVHFGDANNLSNIQSGTQARVIIENPYEFNPYSSEINRILRPGGTLRVTGTQTNKYFNSGYDPITNSKSTGYRDMIKNQTPPPGYIEILKAGKIPVEQRKQGYTGTGSKIGGEENPKPTDLEVELKK